MTDHSPQIVSAVPISPSLGRRDTSVRTRRGNPSMEWQCFQTSALPIEHRTQIDTAPITSQSEERELGQGDKSSEE